MSAHERTRPAALGSCLCGKKRKEGDRKGGSVSPRRTAGVHAARDRRGDGGGGVHAGAPMAAAQPPA